MDKSKPLYTIVGNENWCRHYGKQYRGSLIKKTKIELPYDPAIPLLGIYLRKVKILIPKDTHTLMFTAKFTCTLMFTAELFTISKTLK